MDRKTVVGKTAKGLREALGKSHALTRDTRELLKEVDGKSSVGELLGNLEDWTEGELMQALQLLIEGDFVRELELDSTAGDSPQPPARPPPRPRVAARRGAELDFTRAPAPDEADTERSRSLALRIAQMRAEAEAKQQAEAAAKREADVRARQEADERARQMAVTLARQAAEIKAQQQAAIEKAQREAEERARQEAAERARHEAEERARQEAAEKARREVEERARQEAAERAQREAEERARQEAAERARREAEERARQEAAEKARREAEERARLEIEERLKQELAAEARREAEERARQVAAAQAQLEEEQRVEQAAREQARLEAEAQAARAAQERARREVEEQAERAAEELVRQHAAEQSSYEVEAPVEREAAAAYPSAALPEAAAPLPPIKWGKLAVLVLVGLLLAVFAVLQFTSFDGRIGQLEKRASAQFQQPVKIRALQLSLLPQPHWLVEGLAIGAQGQIRAPRVKLVAPLGDMFGDLKGFDSVHVDAPVLNAEGLGWLVFGRAGSAELKLGRIVVANARLEATGFALPVLNATVELAADGNWRAMSAESADGKFSLTVQGARDGVQVSLRAASLDSVFAAAPAVEDVVATGLASRGGINIKEYTARAFGGTLSGRARLNWATAALIDGDISAKQVDSTQLFAGFLENGRIEGKGSFSLPLPNADKPAAPPRLDGEFSVDKGVLVGVDLGRMLQSGAGGGQTPFTRLSGSGSFQAGRTQLQALRLDAGKLSARGSADVDANRAIRGQFVVELNLGGEQRRAGVALSGTFKPPYKSVEWVRR